MKTGSSTNDGKPIELAVTDVSKVETPSAQMVRVRAVRAHHIGENMSGELIHPGNGEKSEYDCLRLRAAQLRANGIIEYVDSAVGVKIHGEDLHKSFDEQIASQMEAEKIPASAKGTPLKNPALKYSKDTE